MRLGSLADGEGFEPPVPCGTPVFKTGAFDHSATRPNALFDSTDKKPRRKAASRLLGLQSRFVSLLTRG